MRLVIQRVTSARVTVGNRITGSIKRGLVVFLGIEETDGPADGEWLARKLATLRVFDDADGRMNLSLSDLATRGETSPLRPADSAGTDRADAPAHPGVLLVSQFTLFASLQKGTRPSFNRAAKPALARALYEQFIVQLAAATGCTPATGEFGARMQVELANDGPVTLIIDSKRRE